MLGYPDGQMTDDAQKAVLQRFVHSYHLSNVLAGMTVRIILRDPCLSCGECTWTVCRVWRQRQHLQRVAQLPGT